MGANYNFSTVKIFLKAFAGLRQKVLWKFELADVGTQLPDNVRITPWAPQQDLLGNVIFRSYKFVMF